MNYSSKAVPTRSIERKQGLPSIAITLSTRSHFSLCQINLKSDWVSLLRRFLCNWRDRSFRPTN
ncbi:MAG: hypothetical protein F6J93_23325 [Oscillatoria sp. SIO1A7]|nr:hypothetical protein [Oscillatoria sp. SIO1A7]